MMSSRWPRPIGVIASMALMPVWSGSLTGCRSAMPGAIISIGRVVSARMGPFPSRGLPSGSTTRPMSPGPTGTSSSAPVRRTVWPSFRSLYSPRMIAPIEPSSRLKTWPRTPPSNSSISPASALSRPWMRAMPSPTSRIVPTSATSSVERKDSISLRRTAVISSGLNRMALLGDRDGRVRLREALAQLGELTADAAVGDEVADAQHGPADERGADDVGQDRRLAQRRRQARADGLDRVRRHRRRRRERHPHAAEPLVEEALVGVGDLGQGRHALALEQHVEEVREQVRRLAAKRLVDRRVLRVAVDAAREEERAHRPLAPPHGGERGELLAHGLEGLPRLGRLRERARVDGAERLLAAAAHACAPGFLREVS